MSPSEIAGRLNKNPNTIRSWKSRDGWDDGIVATQQDETQHSDATETKREKRSNKKLSATIADAKGLTEKEKDFCLYYIQSYNGTQAAYKAGYKGSHGTVKNMAYRLLNHRPEVINLIEYLKRMKRESILADVDDVIDLHMRIAFADMSGFVKWNKNSLQLLPTDQIDGNLIREISVSSRTGTKIKLEGRQKSLDFLERYFLINPMDQHRQRYEQGKLELESKRTDAIVEKTKQETEALIEAGAIRRGEVGRSEALEQSKAIADMINTPAAERILADFMGVKDSDEHSEPDSILPTEPEAD